VSESNRDASGRLVPSMRVVLKRGADTVGSTLTATTGTPLNLTAELTGGSQPVRSLWQLRYSTGALVEIGTRDSRALSYTFQRGRGSYELLFSAFQEGTGLRASQRVADQRAASRSQLPFLSEARGQLRRSSSTRLNVTLRNTRGSAVAGPCMHRGFIRHQPAGPVRNDQRRTRVVPDLPVAFRWS
jgi:hypothetical protein